MSSYKLITATDMRVFEEKMADAIDAGWEERGQLQVINRPDGGLRYFQPMHKPDLKPYGFLRQERPKANPPRKIWKW